MSLKSDVEAMIAACPAVEAAITPLTDALVALREAEEAIYANNSGGTLISTMSNFGRRRVMNIAMGHLMDAIEGRTPSASLADILTTAWDAELAMPS